MDRSGHEVRDQTGEDQTKVKGNRNGAQDKKYDRPGHHYVDLSSGIDERFLSAPMPAP